MAKLKIVLDTRSELKDGTFPLKIYVSHKSKVRYIPLNIYLKQENWVDNEIVELKDAKRLNRTIELKKKSAEGIIAILDNQRLLKKMDVSELVNRIETNNTEQEQEPEGYSFYSHMQYYIDNCKSERTKQIYRDTISRIEKFTDIRKLDFKDINLVWLKAFEKDMANTCRTNTISIHMRNIRAVFNDAINEDRIDQRYYPFRKYQIRTEKTVKRSLTLDQLKYLRDFNGTASQNKYRDLFLLSFYLIGINPVDLINLKPIHRRNGRIDYKRSKVDQDYSIRIEPEAQQLLRKYKGQNYLLDVREQYDDHRYFINRWNLHLQQILPELTTYWARHTWATIAGKAGVDVDTISKALGHETGAKTTWIYLDFDRDKIDAANRKVIDYLFN